MVQRKKLQIFVSSTYKDLIPERQAAVMAILQCGHIPAGMELFSASSESQAEVIRRWIDESDVFMLILGSRYGTVESKSAESFVEMEYRYALKTGKPSFAVVLSDEALIEREKLLGNNATESENRDKYKNFRKLVLSSTCCMFNDEKDIQVAVLKSLNDIANRFELPGWISGSGNSNMIDLLNRKGRDMKLGDPVGRILNARNEVWITGTTLNTATSGSWRGLERTHARIKVILPDFTKDSIVEATAITDKRIGGDISRISGLENQRGYIQRSWEFLNSSRTRAGGIEVKILPYCPSYSVFAVDAERSYKTNGYISIEMTGYHYEPQRTPGFVLFKNNDKHREFYDLFISMWNEMWNDAYYYRKSE